MDTGSSKSPPEQAIQFNCVSNIIHSYKIEQIKIKTKIKTLNSFFIRILRFLRSLNILNFLLFYASEYS